MHGHFYAILALDLAGERVREAERRARLLRGAGGAPRSLPRRILERLAAWTGFRGRGEDPLLLRRGTSA
jgi:hypothetical protein